MLITIIIATHNRCESLKEVLKCLLIQEKKGFDYEIVVVDNNSRDKTRAMVESLIQEFHEKYSVNVRYIFEGRQGKSFALNNAVQQSRGDIIAFTDDDVIVDPKWLLNIFQCFETYQCDVVGGRVIPVYPEGTSQWIKENAIQLPGAVVIYDYGIETIKFHDAMFPFIGANYAFRRQVFDKYGFFRADLGPGTKTLGEDTEFIERLISKGQNLYYCGSASVLHPFDPRRLKLRHIARWHIALGKFHAQLEILSRKKFVYFFGAPRYLMIKLVKNLFLLSFSWNKPAFIKRWRIIFRSIGMIQEYMEFNKGKRIGHV